MDDNLPAVVGHHTKIIPYTPGMKITETCAVAGMPMSVYHGQPCDGFSVSSSGLRKIFNESLAHFYDGSTLNPKPAKFKDTEFTILGRAAHHLLLGEEDFDQFFVLRPDDAPDGRTWNGNNLTCKAWLAEREEEGLTVITKDQIEKIRGMSKALSEEPLIRGGLLNGLVEISMFWRDEETGIWMKSRPDNIPLDSADAADLKCVSDITTKGLERGLANNGYHQQGAMVGEALQKVFGVTMTSFPLVYVESDRPFCVRIQPVHPEDLDAGYKENHAALRLLRRAIDSNYWPGPQSPAGEGGFIRRDKFAAERAARKLAIIEQELASS